MNLSFKNRIALYYMLATAIIIAIVFGAIYFTVVKSIMNNLDRDLSFEAHKHSTEVGISQDTIQFINKAEWEEREHRELQINPVFIQLTDAEGNMMDRSPNLKESFLPFDKSGSDHHFNTQLDNRPIRQIQLPLKKNEKITGYILAAIPLESAQAVIMKLRSVLKISFLLILSGLYFISRFLAGRSILPVLNISDTVTRITQQNLKERIEIPHHRDEIFDLASNFNALLDRIENALEREKQFTSDASHELRTPLATIRGTLEVLVRKPRSAHEYEEKIQYTLQEISRMTTILEQLLLLSRLESNIVLHQKDFIQLPDIIEDALIRFRQQIEQKDLSIQFDFALDKDLKVPQYYSSILIDNLLGNAIKYSYEGKTIKIKAYEENGRVVCIIEDEGIGIKKEDQDQIFQSFYRSEALKHKEIRGTGLGLSIVKKCAAAIQADLKVESAPEEGTIMTLTFSNKNI
ncbi:MAG: HAMP domain-containing histidine kinase, partial [Saprospiraceae bacterium]|nr:HAMP domain-containing histidine kinase [Saprospiraceae bacterium]